MIAKDLEKYVDKGLSGLANLGNSCYLNSCMQLLSHTYELNYFLDSLNETKLNNMADSLVIIEWNKLRSMMWNENCRIAPWGFLKAIQKVSAEKKMDLFSGYQQNDISEYLIFIIDCLHNSLKREVNMTINGDAKNDIDKLAIDCYNMMKKIYKGEYSEILNIFFGISVTQIKSLENDEVLSRMCEPFSIISLPITSGNNINLMECMDEYCSNEEMKDENSWFNDKTNEKQDVKKSVFFWSLPNILIIELKRYNNNIKKNNGLIDIPINDADFTKYVHGYNNGGYIYDLYGVANHSGGVRGGHYTCTIRNANGNWYNFNDMLVNKIEETNVISPKTYCLFYRKKNKI